MATLQGKITDVTHKPPESLSSITVKAPSARVGGGTDLIVSSPATVDFDRDTGDVTISGLTGGLSWLHLEGEGWSDSIALSAAEGMISLVEAIANASSAPGIIDYLRLLADFKIRFDETAQGAVDEAIGTMVDETAIEIGTLDNRVSQLEPRDSETHEETAWAHITSEGDRLPLGYSPLGRLDEHAKKVFREDIVSTYKDVNDSEYAHVVTTPTGEILMGFRRDGTVEIPSLSGGSVASSSSGASSGMKLVPLALTLPGSAATTSGSRALRIVRKWAHFPGRVRVHLSNRHPVSGNFSDEATITNSLIGIGSETGEITSEQELFAAGATVPGDGEELVSRWITLNGEDGNGLAISLAWEGNSVRLFKGGAWVSSDPNNWDSPSTEGWAWRDEAPFYIWVEAEVPGRVPVVLVNGDSISIGSLTDNPVTDAWVSQYAMKQHALPVFASWHGSSMPHWAPDTGQWDRLYPGCEIRPDAIVMALGQNDVNHDLDVDILKARYRTLREVYDARFPGVPVYVGTINASTKPPEKEVIRRGFNDWLKGLPRGERGYLDFASVLDDPTGEFLLPELTGDGLHPNSAGQTLMADVVLASPISPYVMTTTQMKRL